MVASMIVAVLLKADFVKPVFDDKAFVVSGDFKPFALELILALSHVYGKGNILTF
jgi:hypothetical protein